MVNTRQLLLPRFSGIKRIKKARQLPQPRVGEFRLIKQYEIFHRPFDLRFRGRINEWLKQIRLQKKFNFSEVLDRGQFKIVKLYFYPQMPEKKWLNQEEVLERIGKRSKKKLKTSLVSALIRIWKKEKQK